jgi:DNA-binding GntR family transcriptional regulator
MHRLEVLEELRNRITSGHLPPGGHIVETDLTTEFGLSRTPIRSVLRTLADEGLVVIEPNRGAFVAEWTSSDAAEVMSIRSVLEALGAELAAQRRTEAQLAAMTTLCRQMDNLNEHQPKGFRGKIAELNHEFHLAILAASASPRLYNIAKDLALAPLMSGSFQYYDPDELNRSLQDHNLLVDAIRRRDSPAAKALMESHLRTAYAALSRRQEAAG